MNGKQLNYVRDTICNEGFGYAFIDYSDFADIKDEEFPQGARGLRRRPQGAGRVPRGRCVKKTVFPPMKQVIDDMDKIARDLQDIKTIIACICWQQDDHKLQVPFDALAALPKGLELEIAVDRVHGNYVFTAIAPSDPASVKDSLDNPAVGEGKND